MTTAPALNTKLGTKMGLEDQHALGGAGHFVPAPSGQSVAVRRLTPTECERLQGFPDGWTEGQADSARYRQLGNAVAVPAVEWISRRLMEVAS